MQEKRLRIYRFLWDVIGVLDAAGSLYMDIDYGLGCNHAWLGGKIVDSFTNGNPILNWEALYAINIGDYFMNYI